MKKVLIGLMVGISLLAGCSSEGVNQVGSTDDTEIKLTTNTILTEQSVATCVVALSTKEYEAPAVDCVWENGER